MQAVIERVVAILDANDVPYKMHQDRILIPFKGESEDQEIGVEIRFADVDLPGIDGNVPIVHLRTDLLVGMPLEAGNFAKAVNWTSKFNSGSYLLKAIVGIHDSGDGEEFGRISLEADLIGSSLDADELMIPLVGMGLTGDEWDDALAAELGGVTYVELLRTVAPNVDS